MINFRSRKKKNDTSTKNLLICAYGFDLTKLIFHDININNQNKYVNIKIKNQEDLFNLADTLLLPIYISDSICEHTTSKNKYDSNVYEETIDANQTTLDILYKTSKEVSFSDINYTKCYTDMQVLLLRHLKNRWNVFYKHFGFVQEQYPGIFKLKLDKESFLFSNNNGKIKRIKDEASFYFDEFIAKTFGMSSEEIWDIVQGISKIPCSKERNIVQNNNSYFFIEKERSSKLLSKKEDHYSKEKIVRLTNWTGTITESFEDSNGDICWNLVIDDNEVPLFPYHLCSAKSFQQALARKGMYFFYGTDNHLKFLLSHLHEEHVSD